MICSSVLLPEPLRPTMPTTSPAPDLERHVAQRPELVAVALAHAGKRHVLEPILRAVVQAVDLAHRVHGHEDLVECAALGHRYITSAKPFFVCMNHA